jgi:two-component system chemotaxis response regulator CheB
VSGHDVFAFGFSRGGTDALHEILASLSPGSPVIVFVVQHRSRDSHRYLERILGGASRLPICFVQTDQPVQPGCVYVAPPDRHLLVWRDRLLLSRGPRENRSRPAIDPLFRSVAVSYGPRVVGVLLSGLLNDGTLGLQAIKTCGGVTVIQDPEEAPFPEMVVNAREAVEIDHSLPAAGISRLLARLAQEPAGLAPPVPRNLITEVRIASQGLLDVKDEETEDLPIAPVALTCPDCGGPLGRLDNPRVDRYRCRIGHAFTAEELAEGQADMAESALGAALRTLEERAQVLTKLARTQREKEHMSSAESYEARAQEARGHADHIRRMMAEGGDRET